MANVPTINDPVSKIYTPSEFPVWKSDLLRNLEVTKNALIMSYVFDCDQVVAVLLRRLKASKGGGGRFRCMLVLDRAQHLQRSRGWARGKIKTLVEAGATVFLASGKTLPWGKGDLSGSCHVKLVLTDGSAFCGSANLTNAASSNIEFTFKAWGTAVSEYVRVFNDALLQSSIVHLEQ